MARQLYLPYGGLRCTSGAMPTDYGFTGLMYFRARFYDPALGRFISADSIVPEPGNPQALNRYSLVLNSPLRYIDPTGNRPCDSLDSQGQCETEGNWRVKRRDNILLTPWGNQMEDVCARLGGGLCGLTTAKELLGLVLTREWGSIDPKSGADRTELLAHATTHSMYMKCDLENGGQQCGSLSRNAILNWVGGYSSVAQSLPTGGRIPTALSSLAADVMELIFNPPDAEWTLSRGAINAEPGSWGNASMYDLVDIESFLAASGLGKPLWTYGQPGQDLFYVFTVAQGNALTVEQARLVELARRS